MKNRLEKIMTDLEEIIRKIEDDKNVLHMQYIASKIENHEWLTSALNVQIRLLDDMESDSRHLHQEIDETILDIQHNRI